MNLLREALAWSVFAVVVGLLSVWPRYEIVERGEAIVSLTFSHAGKRIGECRTLTQEELDKLPPNMRRPTECPRGRHPIRVELRSGDAVLFTGLLAPSGIWGDGKANVYRRFQVPKGTHELFVGMNDSGGESGFDYEAFATVDIAPGRNVVVRFDRHLQQFSIF